MVCLSDFGLLDTSKKIISFSMLDLTANYLAHEMHFKGIKDTDILISKDWKLFGMSPHDVARRLERISFKGHFVFQYSGEILNIDWKYQNMEEFANGSSGF